MNKPREPRALIPSLKSSLLRFQKRAVEEGAAEVHHVCSMALVDLQVEANKEEAKQLREKADKLEAGSAD